MLDRIRQYFVDHPDRDAFFKIISMHFPYNSIQYRLIRDAYDLAKVVFKDIYREGENRERYFEHLRRVTLIVLLHLRVRDAELIAAAILHDIIEDIEKWTQEKISQRFTQRTGELVWWVSKPPVSDFGGDKENRNNFFHQRLMDAPRDSMIIKLPDRLDNNMSLWGLESEKQKRKIEETKNFFLPLTQKHIILIHEMEDALKEVRQLEK